MKTLPLIAANDFNFKDHLQTHPAANLLIQPHVLKALFNIRLRVCDITNATGVPHQFVRKACQAWNIDTQALRQQGLVQAKKGTDEKFDPDISPFDITVSHACQRLGWDETKFIQSYKVFRSNRQRTNTKHLRRPARIQKQNDSNLCQMNLMEYFMLWNEHSRDSFLRMGRSRRAGDRNFSTALQVCRKDHNRPYTFDNCLIGEQSENMREMHQRTKAKKDSGWKATIINGVVFDSRAEAKKHLGKSESWLISNEGDYDTGIYKAEESRELLLEFIADNK